MGTILGQAHWERPLGRSGDRCIGRQRWSYENCRGGLLSHFVKFYLELFHYLLKVGDLSAVYTLQFVYFGAIQHGDGGEGINLAFYPC